MRSSYSQNQTHIISSTVTASPDSRSRRAYYLPPDLENKELPLTQQGHSSRHDTIDVYSSQSELAGPISFDESDSSKKSDVDRRSYATHSRSYQV
jgi:hypothetical protein